MDKRETERDIMNKKRRKNNSITEYVRLEALGHVHAQLVAARDDVALRERQLGDSSCIHHMAMAPVVTAPHGQGRLLVV
jgi:hypothetical protein